MKSFLSLPVAVLLVSIATAAPVEISTWQNYRTINISAEAPTTETITLVPVWTLDCGKDAAELVGTIVSAAPGLDGRTLLLDSQLVQVLVIDPAGKVERTVGRPGDGPGDLPGAYRAFQLSDGRIGVAAGAPAMTLQFGGTGKIILLDQAGDPAGRWYGAGDPAEMPVSSVRKMRCANDHVLTASQQTAMSAAGMSHVFELAVLKPDAGDRTVVVRSVFVPEMNSARVKESSAYEPFAYGRCDISVGGRVVFAPVRNQWLVVISEPNGEGFCLERPWRPAPRSKADLRKAQAAMGDPDQDSLFKNKPAVGRVRWRPDGRLWVEVLAEDPTAFATFDEFSPVGELQRRVQIKANGDREHDVLIIMENGRFALLRGFKPGAAEDSDQSVQTEVLLLEPAG